MTNYDEQLRELQRKIARKGHLEAVRAELRARQEELTQKTAELNRIKIEEQADVNRLEGGSLARFFYNVIGKMDEKLDKERAEAYAAAVKYDAAVRELAAVEEDLRRNAGEWNELRDCERRYEQLKKEKADAIRASGRPEEKALLELEERVAALESQIKELREAIRAGERARSLADEVLSRLDDAEGLSTWDLFGGGLIADIAKHDSLDSAQSAVERLQAQLTRFKTELADVTVRADLYVSVDGFTRFADFFFDGLFADLAVREQIQQSQNNVWITRSQISEVLKKLENMVLAAERDHAVAAAQLDDLIKNTSV